MIYELLLKSVTPEKLVKGRTYLCGRSNGCIIDWTTREFDGETLRICTDDIMLGDGPTYPIDEEYMCVIDDVAYLIFELPTLDTTIPTRHSSDAVTSVEAEKQLKGGA